MFVEHGVVLEEVLSLLLVQLLSLKIQILHLLKTILMMQSMKVLDYLQLLRLAKTGIF